METYHIIATRRANSNTAEHGFGDYPTYTDFVACTVEAETIRKAQNKAQKVAPKSVHVWRRFWEQVLDGRRAFSAPILARYIGGMK